MSASHRLEPSPRVPRTNHAAKGAALERVPSATSPRGGGALSGAEREEVECEGVECEGVEREGVFAGACGTD